MRKIIIHLVIAVLCIQFIEATVARGADLVVMIPGTLTDLIPGSSDDQDYNPYFSKAILESVAAKGYQIEIVKGLLPTGDLITNCKRAEYQIQQIYRKWQGRIDNIVLLGHSMGGLLSLCVTSRNQNLPIRKNVLVATPLEGSFVADQAFASPIWGEWLTDLAYGLSSFWDFRGIPELTRNNVTKYLNNLHLPDSVEIYLATGVQKAPDFPFTLYSAEYLSPIMALASYGQDEDSDGMVSVSSALGFHTTLRSVSGRSIKLNRLTQIIGSLDHAKQVIDYQWFVGCENRNLIEKRQRQFYSQIFTMIENLH